MDVEKIGKFIKELRAEKKLTQKELSEKLNITVQAVSKWERGKGLPDISYLEDLSSIFEVSILEILKGERTDKIEHKDILYSVKYGKETTKEKILRIINNSIITTVLIVTLFLFIGNMINVYYGNIKYINTYEKSYIPIIKENYKMINTIRDNQGIFNDEDYNNILSELDNMESYLNIIEQRINKDELTNQDIFRGWFLGSTIYEILYKYKNLDDQEIRRYHTLHTFSIEYLSAFSEGIGKNMTHYQIDNGINQYLEFKNESDNLIVEYTNIVLKHIIEAGDIYE